MENMGLILMFFNNARDAHYVNHDVHDDDDRDDLCVQKVDSRIHHGDDDVHHDDDGDHDDVRRVRGPF